MAILQNNENTVILFTIKIMFSIRTEIFNQSLTMILATSNLPLKYQIQFYSEWI